MKKISGTMSMKEEFDDTCTWNFTPWPVRGMMILYSGDGEWVMLFDQNAGEFVKYSYDDFEYEYDHCCCDLWEPKAYTYDYFTELPSDLYPN